MENGPPRGTRDLLPEAVAKREAVIAELADSYARFGFRRIETPCIENINRLSWGEGGDNEKLIYRIIRRGLDPVVQQATELSELTDLGLRYDLTVPLTRFYANNSAKLASPFRAMQIGPVWRAERPQKGRYRQFTQCDIDTIGEPSVLAECELLEATLAALVAIGIDRVTVRVNDRRLLAAMAAEAGVPGESLGGFFVTLDKLDKIGWVKVKEELIARGYPEAAGERCEWVVGILSAAATVSDVLDRAADALPGLAEGVLDDLRTTFQTLERVEADVAPETVSSRLDPTIVRGMGYYSGQIFEIAHPDSPSSIAGGGRYDGLVGRSLGTDVAACGISIGFDRVVDMARFDPPDLGLAVLYSVADVSGGADGAVADAADGADGAAADAAAAAAADGAAADAADGAAEDAAEDAADGAAEDAAAGAADAADGAAHRAIGDVLAAGRRLRASGRSAALVVRKGQMKLQLDALKAEGYSSFVVLGDSVSDERPLRD